MRLKIPIADPYAGALNEIGGILRKVMANKEVEEIFNRYQEVVNSDEAAAILTLAEILKGNNDAEPEAGADAAETKTKRGAYRRRGPKAAVT